MPDSASDRKYMQRALALAVRGQGSVEPNPMVGCVIVRAGHVLGEGYHRRFGGAHAEVEALRHCSHGARGATVYVTLEPCCHVGKTGPCTDALLAAGVGRVVAAMRDPDPRVAGRGISMLRRRGVRVDVDVCREEAERLNAPYLALRRRGVPWVIAKWAQSVDGRIATRTGASKWISGSASRAIVHGLRGRVDAVVVGIGTVLADDPSLTSRVGRPKRIARRVVLDSRLRIPLRCVLVRTAKAVPVIVATTRAAIRRTGARARHLEAAGVEVLPLASREGRVDLHALLAAFGRRSMTNVLFEGGGDVLGSLFDERLVNEAYVFISPRVLGGAAARSAVGGRGCADLHDAANPAEVEWRDVDDDRLCRLVWRG